MPKSVSQILRLLLWMIAGLLLGILLFDRAAALYVDASWFGALGYLPTLLTTISSRLWIGVMAFFVAFFALWWNVRYAWQQRQERVLILLVTPVSLGFAWVMARQWLTIISWPNGTEVGTIDPIYKLDLGFYLFSLPAWEALQSWAFNLTIMILSAVAITYVTELGLAKQRLTVSLPLLAQQHLIGIGGVVLIELAWGRWLERYELLYSSRGVVFGASFTDVNVQQPMDTLLTGFALITAGVMFWIAFKRLCQVPITPSRPRARIWFRMVLAPLTATLGTYWIATLVLGSLIPNLIQTIVVAPDELEKERPYIEHNIQFTRQGFDLTDVEVQQFSDQGRLTREDIDNNTSTIRNLRLWDAEPLLATYRQLQEIRPYYQFPFLDVDRYEIGGELRQVMHSARELDYSKVPDRAQRWVNERFYFTHGYGFTLSPVNVVTREGLPDFFISNIPPEASNEAVAEAIPIENPAIYYGELTETNVFVRTDSPELHYSMEDEQIFGRYQGEGGVPFPGQDLWRRLFFSWHFHDFRIWISQELTSETRFMFHREILGRARQVAPFLRYDNDPYMVIKGGKLYWILDAYTTSNRYPYSEHAEPPYTFNYIRNSVKMVIDAYTGEVNLYVFEPEDPLIRTYQAIFPSMFRPREEMPADLMDHIRYPTDLFQVQVQQYTSYHMSDPVSFYNREDQWQIPTQVREGKGQPMQPQYLILQLPETEDDQPEFVLISSYTPLNKQNLIAWMAAGCDGENYGKLLVYQFSRQRLIFGPQQVEARINQNPVISEQLSLWNEHGSRVNPGNLLVIPIENSLLYLQPLYLEAEESRLPQLTRIMAAYEDQVVMRPTLREALDFLFPLDPEVIPESLPEPEEQEETFPEPSERILTQLPDLSLTNQDQQELVQEALRLWTQAQESLRVGAWAEYGQIQSELKLILEELEQRSQPESATALE